MIFGPYIFRNIFRPYGFGSYIFDIYDILFIYDFGSYNFGSYGLEIFTVIIFNKILFLEVHALFTLNNFFNVSIDFSSHSLEQKFCVYIVGNK